MKIKVIKIAVCVALFLGAAYGILYAVLLYTESPQVRAFDSLRSGSVRITELSIGKVVFNGDHEISVINDAFKIGYHGGPAHIVLPYDAYVGRIKTSNGVELKLAVWASIQKSAKIGLFFLELDDTSYIIELPEDILTKFYADKI